MNRHTTISLTIRVIAWRSGE